MYGIEYSSLSFFMICENISFRDCNPCINIKYVSEIPGLLSIDNFISFIVQKILLIPLIPLNKPDQYTHYLYPIATFHLQT